MRNEATILGFAAAVLFTGIGTAYFLVDESAGDYDYLPIWSGRENMLFVYPPTSAKGVE